MLLDIAKEAEIAATVEACWQLIGDIQRLSSCIPGVGALHALEEGSRYAATITDKLGPFRIQLPVKVTVVESTPPRRLAAELAGDDGRGQARVKGQLEALLEPINSGTKLRLNAQLEVLGKLAALGATPMRRRADETFDAFVREVKAQLESAPT
jgi:uncharacterized protein